MTRAMWPFAFASLAPAGLLALGLLLGGLWAWAGVLAITVAVFFADKWQVERAPSDGYGHGLSVSLGLAHFVLLALGIWTIGQDTLPAIDQVALVIGLGLWFGQVSNSNAHELIHRRARGPYRLGVAIYSSMLFGHHASAHPLVHHVHAATPEDPNSAPMGLGYWRYALRAWRQGYRAGLKAENRRRKGTARWRHPYLWYWVGAFVTVAYALSLGGLRGGLALFIIAAYAQSQLLLSDYVQHYGLQRRILPDGKPEPMGMRHSWNAAHPASTAMMLNAPRHSDHHMRPGKAFPGLEINHETMPMLPHSLPVMAVIALVPPLWRRMMDHRAAAWALDAPSAVAARDIPRAVLDKVREGGMPVRDLPVLPHEDDSPDPRLDASIKQSRAGRADDGGGL